MVHARNAEDSTGTLALEARGDLLEPGRPAVLEVTGSAAGGERWFGVLLCPDDERHHLARESREGVRCRNEVVSREPGLAHVRSRARRHRCGRGIRRPLAALLSGESSVSRSDRGRASHPQSSDRISPGSGSLAGRDQGSVEPRAAPGSAASFLRAGTDGSLGPSVPAGGRGRPMLGSLSGTRQPARGKRRGRGHRDLRRVIAAALTASLAHARLHVSWEVSP